LSSKLHLNGVAAGQRLLFDSVSATELLPVEQFAMLLTHLLLLQRIGRLTGQPLIGE
jgi:hypothetical protein